MYRAHTINVTNNFCNYQFTPEDMKYIRPEERDHYEDDLRNGRSMTKYQDSNAPIDSRNTSQKRRPDCNRLNNYVPERELKRLKSAPPPLSTPVLKPGDRGPDNRRILPRAPISCRTDKHWRSYKKWLNCWHKVQDMKDRMRKEYRKKGGRCPLERLEWPDWTPEWYKRKGEMWQWDLPGNEELITAFQDRQEAKEPYGYRDPFADSDDESEMSDYEEEFSDME